MRKQCSGESVGCGFNSYLRHQFVYMGTLAQWLVHRSVEPAIAVQLRGVPPIGNQDSLVIPLRLGRRGRPFESGIPDHLRSIVQWQNKSLQNSGRRFDSFCSCQFWVASSSVEQRTVNPHRGVQLTRDPPYFGSMVQRLRMPPCHGGGEVSTTSRPAMQYSYIGITSRCQREKRSSSLLYCTIIGLQLSWLERSLDKRKVAGSIPARPTNQLKSS